MRRPHSFGGADEEAGIGELDRVADVTAGTMEAQRDNRMAVGSGRDGDNDAAREDVEIGSGVGREMAQSTEPLSVPIEFQGLREGGSAEGQVGAGFDGDPQAEPKWTGLTRQGSAWDVHSRPVGIVEIGLCPGRIVTFVPFPCAAGRDGFA